MQAIGYARWSSLEQGKGQTLERQQRLVRNFCEARSWPLIEEVTDEGTSAYTGANIHSGNLAGLVRRIEEGRLGGELVIVVEQLDRISRLPPSQVVGWIQRVVSTGVRIATVNDGVTIDRDMIDANPMNFMSLVFNAFRAYQESKHKSERLSESWALKRARLEQGEVTPLTGVCPAWLRLDKSNGRFELIEERAALVREIFERTIAGDGKAAIAADFNARGIEPWGRGASRADGWHTSYIQKILTNSAVIGEFQAHTKARGDVRRSPVGDAFQGYFPAAVSEKQWAAVRALKPLRRGGGNGHKGDIRNLFAGLCRCRLCGGAMVYQFKADDGFRTRAGKKVAQKRQSYLLCSRRIRKLGCENGRYYRYETLESGLLDGALEAALKDGFFSVSDGIGAISDEHFRLLREADAQRAKVRRLLDLYAETGDEDVKARWQLAKQQLGGLEEQSAGAQERLERARGATSPEQHVRRVNEVRAQLVDPDPGVRLTARRRVMHSLRELIDYMTFDDVGRINMVLTGGGYAIRFDDEGNIHGDVRVGAPSRISDPAAQAEALRALDDP